MTVKTHHPENRAGLVLTPIVDKNGRHTRVWRKPFNMDGSKLVRVPITPSSVATNTSYYNIGFDPGRISESPWGKISSMGELFPGIYIVEAESGRGALLSPARREEIDPRWNIESDGGWYSADGLGWAVIPFTFEEEFGAEAAGQAADYLIDYRPHEYMEITGEIIGEEESEVLASEAFEAEHVGEFAANSFEEGVFPDEVIVNAGRIGDESGEEQLFVVSKEELEEDGELPKGHRKLIDEERHPKTTSEIENLKKEFKDALKSSLVTRFPKSRYALSLYSIIVAGFKQVNDVRDAEDEDEYIGKQWGMNSFVGGMMSQLILEMNSHKEAYADINAVYARELRKWRRRQNRHRWLQKVVG